MTDEDENVIIEIKGQANDDADTKAKAARRWTSAVTRLGSYGTWHYLFVTEPGRLGLDMDAYTEAAWDQGSFELT